MVSPHSLSHSLWTPSLFNTCSPSQFSCLFNDSLSLIRICCKCVGRVFFPCAWAAPHPCCNIDGLGLGQVTTATVSCSGHAMAQRQCFTAPLLAPLSCNLSMEEGVIHISHWRLSFSSECLTMGIKLQHKLWWVVKHQQASISCRWSSCLIKENSRIQWGNGGERNNLGVKTSHKEPAAPSLDSWPCMPQYASFLRLQWENTTNVTA